MLFLRFKSLIFLRNKLGSALEPFSRSLNHLLRFIPFLFIIILLEFETPQTLIFMFKLFNKYSSWFNNCLISSDPTFPTPVMKTLTSLIFFSKNVSCSEFKAFLIFFLLITALIFLSDAPWDIALTLMLL